MSKLVGGVGITPLSDRFSAISGKFNNICIDYLTITWQFDEVEKYNKNDVLYTAAKYLNIEDSEVILDNKNKGFYGYSRKYLLGTEIFYQDGLKVDPSLNIYSKMIEISGSGCRDLERRNVDLVKFAEWVFKSGGTITRFDLAYDDFICEHCDIKLIRDYLEEDHFVSTIQYWNYIIGRKNGIYVEHAITFGKRSANKQLQIYDKLLERKVNYEVDTDFIDKWIRYEMRFKSKEVAHLVFKDFVDVLKIEDENFRTYKIKEFYFGRLKELLDIKIKSKAINKSELPTADFWNKFCNNFEKIKIRNQYKIESDIVVKKKWVERSVIKPLAKIGAAVGFKNTFEALENMCANKMSEFTEKDYLEINNYKKLLSSSGEIDSWLEELNH